MKIRSTTLAAVAATALLSACASPGPDRAAQAAPAPAALPARWAAPLPATPAAQAPTPEALPSLAQVLDDPELAALQSAARAASADLASARARIERARAARVAAGAAEQPRLDATAAAQHGRTLPRTPLATSANLGVQAGWEIDLFGARRAGAAAAEARLSGALAQQQALQRVLDAEVASSLLALRSCVVQRELAEADSRSRDETARLTGLRERAGFAAPADAALARASAAQGRAARSAQRAACEQQLKGLVELTALDDAALRSRLLERESGNTLPTLPTLPNGRAFAVTSLPGELLNRRPDLQDAGFAVQAAAAEQRAAQAKLYPQISIAGSIGLASSRTASISIDGSTWSLGPLQVSWPIFDGGTRRADLSATRSEYDAAVASYQSTLRRAVREVEQALVALAATGEREADASSAAENFDAALRAIEQRHRGGLASLFELEDARRSALAARSALIDLQRERAQAWIDLTRALGGA